MENKRNIWDSLLNVDRLTKIREYIEKHIYIYDFNKFLIHVKLEGWTFAIEKYLLEYGIYVVT